MTSHERRQSILDLLRRQPGLRVPELAQLLSVSEGTVRNDLNALEADGQVTRVHGGAVLRGQNGFHNVSFYARRQEQTAEKTLIAHCAAELVEDGDSILLDASSTAYCLALSIQDRHRLRVVTNGLDVARFLAQNPTNTVILIGGILSEDGSSVTGLLSQQIIRDLHTQKAFVSCSGFSLERGMTERQIEEAQLKREALESARLVVALVDSSKFGREDLTPFARIEQISRLYTDPGITPEWAQIIQQAGIPLTICQAAA
ncbi:MAG TPA: DeoR/GlpR family DNA-binding transcription regulator [Anaerolineae bacterium]|nr:DeoR/GlpR family DNA-binding transcription regulator [Anaerolineae bacterium]